jgi:uncharacterized protein
MKTRITIFLAALLAVGCTALNIDLPPITEAPAGSRSAGRVVWHDLLTNDPVATQRFYSELFGWEFERPGIDVGFGGGSGYLLIRHEGELIGGIVDTRALGRAENISQWVMAISVADVDEAVDRVRAAGGKVLTPATDLPSRGTIAVVADHDGAIFAMVRTRDGDPPERKPSLNTFLWDELWAGNVSAASNFYRAVAGYSVEQPQMVSVDHDYRVMRADGRPRAGIMDNPFGEQPPVWVNYIRVEDPAAITARVAALGGRVIIDARERQVGGIAAFIAGPSGAGVAIQTWPPE